MDTDGHGTPGWRERVGFVTPPTSSFAHYLAMAAPDLDPGRRNMWGAGTEGAGGPAGASADAAAQVPHGTTIVASTYDGGVVMAGDRRATMGHLIAPGAVEKVHAADEHTAIGYAGTAGLGYELVRLYQVELEHYEKSEGTSLSVDGKANRLSMLVRSNLPMALQGLAAVPLLAAYDPKAGRGRIFSYDVTGGRYEEQLFHGVGSGSLFARGSLKKLYRPDAEQEECVLACLQALYDAAEEDSATGGPDVTRQIYPMVAAVDDSGYHRLAEDRISSLVDRLISGRMRRPDGPSAPVLDGDEGE